MGFGHFRVMFRQCGEKAFVLIDKGFKIIESTGTVGERFYPRYRDDFGELSLFGEGCDNARYFACGDTEVFDYHVEGKLS